MQNRRKTAKYLPPAGVEPATLGLLDPRSNRLSYGGLRVGLLRHRSSLCARRVGERRSAFYFQIACVFLSSMQASRCVMKTNRKQNASLSFPVDQHKCVPHAYRLIAHDLAEYLPPPHLLIQTLSARKIMAIVCPAEV